MWKLQEARVSVFHICSDTAALICIMVATESGESKQLYLDRRSHRFQSWGLQVRSWKDAVVYIIQKCGSDHFCAVLRFENNPFSGYSIKVRTLGLIQQHNPEDKWGLSPRTTLGYVGVYMCTVETSERSFRSLLSLGLGGLLTPYDHNARPSQTDGQTDKHHGNSVTIRSKENIVR